MENGLMVTYKSPEEIWEAKSRFSFDKLLEPYIEGGQQDQPVKRSIGTIFDYLINKKKYPLDVAGAALLIVFNELFEGKSFEGDGTYGSKGRELVTYIRIKCDEISQNKLKSQVFENIAGAKMEVLQDLSWEMVRNAIPKPMVPIMPGTWRWLRKRKINKERKTK